VIEDIHKLNVLTLASQVTNNPTWYVDIRYTQHVCYEREYLINYEACESWQVMFLGDNTTHQIARQGEVAIKLLDEKVRQIPNVLHVLGLQKNLFFKYNLTNLEEKFPSSPKYIFSII